MGSPRPSRWRSSRTRSFLIFYAGAHLLWRRFQLFDGAPTRWALPIAVALEASWAQLPSRHREQPRFAVIGYGKLGGKELGYASDLDIIFLYADEDEGPAAAPGRARARGFPIRTLASQSGSAADGNSVTSGV